MNSCYLYSSLFGPFSRPLSILSQFSSSPLRFFRSKSHIQLTSSSRTHSPRFLPLHNHPTHSNRRNYHNYILFHLYDTFSPKVTAANPAISFRAVRTFRGQDTAACLWGRGSPREHGGESTQFGAPLQRTSTPCRYSMHGTCPTSFARSKTLAVARKRPLCGVCLQSAASAAHRAQTERRCVLCCSAGACIVPCVIGLVVPFASLRFERE